MTLRLLACAVVLAAAGGAALRAQTEVVKTETKTELKGGKEITTTGCIDRMSDGRYELTGVGGEPQYLLMGKEDMKKYVGRRVQIRGRATDLGDAELKSETKTTVKTELKDGSSGDTQKTTTTQKGDVVGLRLLGVTSVKTLSKSCQ